MRFLLFITTILCSQIIAAQSGSFFTRKIGDVPVQAKKLSFGGFYTGASLSYALNPDDDEQDFSNQILFDLRGAYDKISIAGVRVPIVGNIDSILTSPNFSIGARPWKIVHSNDAIDIILHGGFDASVSVDNAEGIDSYTAIAGVELDYTGKAGNVTVFNMTPVYQRKTPKGELGGSDQWRLDLDFIYPIANGLGLLAEVQLPVSRAKESTNTHYRFGVIMNKPF